MMTLRQIEVVRAVMISGTISGAAKLLNVSAPGISRLVKYTERSLGVRFFTRQNGRYFPTADAQMIFEQINAVYKKIDDLSDVIGKIGRGELSELRIGSVPSIAQVRVPRAVEKTRRRYPDLRMDINILKIEEAIDYLLLGKGDCAAISYRLDHPALDFLPLASGRLFCIVPEGHALAERKKISAAEMTRFPLIGIEPTDPYGRIMADLFARNKLPYDITIRARFGNTVCSLVQARLGIAVIDQFSVAHGNIPGVRILEIREPTRFDTPAAVMSRAEPLKASLFRQPVGPGELEIPSIRGVGGSLLYFVRGDGENWSRDFEPVTAAPKGHSLTAVDHISQSMPHGDMLSWALFYGGVLDLKRLPQQEVADPVGLVQSQAFINEDDSVRMVLNGSAASRTSSARFISEQLGSGVQHIAFTSNDIFATVARIREQGAVLLDIPDNYYDDLEAKYDFAPGVAKALRDNHILYDRDDSGEFFQAYTRVFDDRFFFEIVQRKNYSGFGAPNAAIRLAAQYREARPAALLRI